MLVGFFFFFYGLTKQDCLDREFCWKSAIKSSLLIPAGATSAVILIFILHRYKDLEMPINIQVNDFFGAVVIGLFTFRLGDWLYKQLSEGKK